MDFGRFISELKRRRVFRVAAGYAIAGLAVGEAIEMVFPRLGAPDWAVSVVIVALLAGFPIVLVLAWALEITPDGIRITPPGTPTRDGGVPAATGRGGYLVVFLLGAALSTGVWFLAHGSDGPTDLASLRSVAVLPFAALSDDPDDQWLAQGLHDQLITELAHLSGLERVISRTSVLRYAEDPPGIAEIAAELGVDAIIEGSILPSPDRVRINVQLIAGATDDHLWAEDYDRTREEALDLVKSVAQDVAREINLQLTEDDETRLEAQRPVDPAAQEAYFRGREAWNLRTRVGMARAEELFQRAIDIDPEYAQAYAGMASLHALGWGGGEWSQAEVWAQRALDLDPRSGEAYAAIAFVSMYEAHDWDRAEEYFRTAVRVQPGYATAYQWGAEMFAALGRQDEALEWAARSRELDPYSGIIAWSHLRILGHAGRHEECLEANDRYDADFPDYSRAGNRLRCLVGAGRFQEAMERLEAPDSVRVAVESGDTDAFWRWQLERPDGFTWVAAAQLGELDIVFDQVEAWSEEGLDFGLNLGYFLAEPLLAPLRADPRWAEKVLPQFGLTEWPS